MDFNIALKIMRCVPLRFETEADVALFSLDPDNESSVYAIPVYSWSLDLDTIFSLRRTCKALCVRIRRLCEAFDLSFGRKYYRDVMFENYHLFRTFDLVVHMIVWHNFTYILVLTTGNLMFFQREDGIQRCLWF